MRNQVVAIAVVLAIMIGASLGYLGGASGYNRTTELSTATKTTTVSFTSEITSTATSYIAATQTVTVTTSAGLGPVWILGASISHNLPQPGPAFSCAAILNSSSYVAIENNGTAAVTVSVLVLKYGNGIYTGGITSTSCSVSPGSNLYLELGGLPAAAMWGELFTVFVIYDHKATQPYTNTFY